VARYRFATFVLSPRKRLLADTAAEPRELPLIPRYFDLLVFLIERRHEAVSRQQIFDSVWRDVVVSDSALSQAIRTIRRTLGDNSREPLFVRTMSRHGYRFVCPDIVEEPDDDLWPPTPGVVSSPPPVIPRGDGGDAFEPLLERLTRTPATAADEEDQYEAAELLHALGTAEALRRLDGRPRHALGRALLRDARWGAPERAAVPILNQPAPFSTAAWLIALRLRRVKRLIATRWAAASFGGGVAGALGGVAGGLMLVAAPQSAADLPVAVVLGLVGAVCGTIGGAGVGAGLAVAEAVARSQRMLALVVFGALGGGLVGVLVEWVAQWTLVSMFGLHVTVGGGVEGVVIAGAASLGYALSTARLGEGLAAPRGWHRVQVAAATAACCGLAALGLALAGRPLVGGTVHLIAQAVQGSQVTLTPIGRLIGEPDFGALARAIIATGEGTFFGLGLAFGLTHRPH
jgi:DNA-binding winged helix-turn-helix (wHTH) protein